MAAKRVVVLGARGVFGSLLVRELTQYEVVPQGRGEFDPRGAYAVACTAGPFQTLDRGMVRACVEAGAHWLDIADDEGWFFDLLDDPALNALARERNVVVIPGLSSLPAVSGALVRRVAPGFSRAGRAEARPYIHITLGIGNRNRKGAAAIASAAMSNGDVLRTPDRELLRRELGIDAETHVQFESSLALPMLRILGRFPKLAAALAKPFRFGTSGGFVEARAGDCVAKIVSRDQRIVVLPLVFALERLERVTPGVHAPSVFDAEELLAFVSS